MDVGRRGLVLTGLAAAASSLFAGPPLARALAPATARPPRLTGGQPYFVSFGDSIAAGTGAQPYFDERYFRSAQSVGGQVAKMLGAGYCNVARSGADTTILTGTDTEGTELQEYDELGGVIQRFGMPLGIFATTGANDLYVTGAILKELSGNILPGPPTNTTVIGNLRDRDYGTTLQYLKSNVEIMLDDMPKLPHTPDTPRWKFKGPHFTQVFVIGYPFEFLPDGNYDGLSNQFIARLRTTFSALNTIQRDAVNSLNAKTKFKKPGVPPPFRYIDTSSVFRGMTANEIKQYMNVPTAHSIYMDAGFFLSSQQRGIPSAPYHPNALGYGLMARVVAPIVEQQLIAAGMTSLGVSRTMG